MSFLIISSVENTRFEHELIRQAVDSLTGVEQLRDVRATDRYADLRWTFRVEGHPLDCLLMKEGRAVEIDEESDLACGFIVAFSQNWPLPLDLINDDYSLHIPLRNLTTGSALWSVVNASYEA